MQDHVQLHCVLMNNENKRKRMKRNERKELQIAQVPIFIHIVV